MEVSNVHFFDKDSIIKEEPYKQEDCTDADDLGEHIRFSVHIHVDSYWGDIKKCYLNDHSRH